MNNTFKELLDICVVVYLDNIPIYSETPPITKLMFAKSCINFANSTSGTQTWGLSGPNKHSNFTPLKGVRHIPHRHHQPDARHHPDDAVIFSYPYRVGTVVGPLCGFIGSEIFVYIIAHCNKKISILL